jgi:hypothetical protein
VWNLNCLTNIARNFWTSAFLACDVVLSDWTTRCAGNGVPRCPQISRTRDKVLVKSSQNVEAPWNISSSSAR